MHQCCQWFMRSLDEIRRINGLKPANLRADIDEAVRVVNRDGRSTYVDFGVPILRPATE